MAYFKYINKILTQKQISFFLLISISLVFISVIELFGISLVIPIIYTLTSESFYNELITLINNYINISISKKEFIIISLFLFAFFFILKNFLLGIFYWIEGKFIYSMSERISSKIFKNFLSRDYSFLLK